MDPLNNDIRIKRLGVGDDMREIGDIGLHPVENLGGEPLREASQQIRYETWAAPHCFYPNK